MGSNESLLLIGRPGVGKTTLLREIAKRLSADQSLVVVVVDKTCEIAGDGTAPHAAIGSARWMPVGRPGLQAQILREGVRLFCTSPHPTHLPRLYPAAQSLGYPLAEQFSQ